MQKILLAILITALLSTACGKDTRDDEPTDRETIEYFNYNLKADLKYNDLVNLFGQPDGDLGSGIHIYVYDLKDGTKVYIGYTDKIMYARHVDSNGQILHSII